MYRMVHNLGYSAFLLTGLVFSTHADTHSGVNTWSKIPLLGEVPGAGSGHDGHGFVTSRGQLYVFGGYYGSSYLPPSNQLVVIDPGSGVCKRLDSYSGVTGNPPLATYSPAFAAWDGILYVLGGLSWVDTNYVHDFHAYEIGRKLWIRLDSSVGVTGFAPGPQGGMGLTAHDDSLWVTCGGGSSDTYQYDINTRIWYVLSSSNIIRSSHVHSNLGTLLYVFGGYGGSVDGTIGYRNDIMALDMGNRTAVWGTLTVHGEIPTPREHGTLVTVGQKLVLFGGMASGKEDFDWTWVNDLFFFQPRTNEWVGVKNTGQMPSGRGRFGNAAVVGCSIYIFGGFFQIQQMGTRHLLQGPFEAFDDLFRYQVAPEAGEDENCALCASGATSCSLSTTPSPSEITPITTPVPDVNNGEDKYTTVVVATVISTLVVLVVLASGGFYYVRRRQKTEDANEVQISVDGQVSTMHVCL